MSDALSIVDAARECGDALALLDQGRPYSFAQLARLALARADTLLEGARGRPRFVPVVGTNSLDTLVTLYALLELRVPALLLHPRLTEPETQAEIEATAAASDRLPADAAVILYTSGTTGRPKGAVLTRSALLASARASAANQGWQPDDRWMMIMPVARVGGLSIVTRCLAARRTVVMEPRFDTTRLPGQLQRERVTLLSLVPTMLALVFRDHPSWVPPASLRALQLGGSAAPAALLERAALRQVPILVTYGCTETCSQVAVTPYDLRFEAARVGAGTALQGAELKVVDGQVRVRGPMLMHGYLGEDPLAPGDWFDTGDLGELDAQGFLHLNGRRGDLIVTGGENVYPAEVERVLQSLPGIEAAGVFGVPDDTWGATVAVAVVPGATMPDDRLLQQHMAAMLAKYKRPRQICVVDALPYNAAGKLDRQALAAFTDRLRTLGH